MQLIEIQGGRVPFTTTGRAEPVWLPRSTGSCIAHQNSIRIAGHPSGLQRAA